MKDELLDTVLTSLGGHVLNDGSAMVHCPAHDDRNPSLHVTLANDKLLVNCQAGCSQLAVNQAFKDRGIRLSKNGDSPVPKLPPGIPTQWYGAKFMAIWTYRNAQGQIMGYVVRYEGVDGKQVVPFCKHVDGKWKAGAAQEPRPLFGLDRLAQSPTDGPILVVEGEKAADAAQRFVKKSHTCLTWQGGTNAAKKTDWTPLSGRDVVIWPDADKPGLKAAQAVAEHCRKAGAKSVLIVNPPENVKKGWDLADAEAEGWTREQVLQHLDHHKQAGPSLQNCFRFKHINEIELTPPVWTIKNLLEANSLALIFGDPESCKTFAAVEIACCVATGQDFHGLDVVQHGPVAYIAGEGQKGIKRRFSAHEVVNQTSLSKSPLFISLMPAGLTDPDNAQQVLSAVDEIARQNGNPALVVVDTVARNFGPGDENSTKDMTAFIAAADQIRAKYGSTFLMIHHSGHGDKNRARGAMALKGALDAEYRMSRDDQGIVRLEACKMKDAPRPEPMAFKLCQVELPILDEEGNQATSAVLKATDYGPSNAVKPTRGKWQQLALDQLQNLFTANRERLIQGGFDPEQARVSVESWRTACIDAGMDRRRWPEVKNSLSTAGAVKLDQNHVFLS